MQDGVWDRESEGCTLKFTNAGVTAMVDPMEPLRSPVMCLRTVHPGNNRGTHLCVGSCTPLVKDSPGELTPSPGSGWKLCKSPKGSAVEFHSLECLRSLGTEGKM